MGMVFYAIATGRSYFEGMKPAKITAILGAGGPGVKEFKPDFSAVRNDQLRDLIEKLCSARERSRLGVAEALLHPYFTSTGFGRWTDVKKANSGEGERVQRKSFFS
jgi:hypothetical protein